MKYFKHDRSNLWFSIADNAPVGKRATLEVPDEQAKELGSPIRVNTETGELSKARAGVPLQIANWRCKAVLTKAGLLTQVISAIDALPADQKTVVKAAWDNNAEIVRNGPTVLAITAALNLTDLQVDDMFIEAAKLTV